MIGGAWADLCVGCGVGLGVGLPCLACRPWSLVALNLLFLFSTFFSFYSPFAMEADQSSSSSGPAAARSPLESSAGDGKGGGGRMRSPQQEQQQQASSILSTALFASAAVALLVGSSLLTHPVLFEGKFRLPTLGDLHLFQHEGFIILGLAVLNGVLLLLSSPSILPRQRPVVSPLVACLIAGVASAVPLAMCYRSLVLGKESEHVTTPAETSLFRPHPELLVESPDVMMALESQLAHEAAARTGAVHRQQREALLKDPSLHLPRSRFHVFLVLSAFPAIHAVAFAVAATLYPRWLSTSTAAA